MLAAPFAPGIEKKPVEYFALKAILKTSSPFPAAGKWRRIENKPGEVRERRANTLAARGADAIIELQRAKNDARVARRAIDKKTMMSKELREIIESNTRVEKKRRNRLAALLVFGSAIMHLQHKLRRFLLGHGCLCEESSSRRNSCKTAYVKRAAPEKQGFM